MTIETVDVESVTVTQLRKEVEELKTRYNEVVKSKDETIYMLKDIISGALSRY